MDVSDWECWYPACLLLPAAMPCCQSMLHATISWRMLSTHVLRGRGRRARRRGRRCCHDLASASEWSGASSCWCCGRSVDRYCLMVQVQAGRQDQQSSMQESRYGHASSESDSKQATWTSYSQHVLALKALHPGYPLHRSHAPSPLFIVELCCCCCPEVAGIITRWATSMVEAWMAWIVVYEIHSSASSLLTARQPLQADSGHS